MSILFKLDQPQYFLIRKHFQHCSSIRYSVIFGGMMNWSQLPFFSAYFYYEGRTESHEQLFFACELGIADEGECGGRWNQLLCYPWVSRDVNSLHHLTSITPNKLADNDMSFRQRAVIEFLVKEEIPAQKFTGHFSVLMEVCAWVRAVFEGGWNILKMGKRRRFRKQCVSVFGWLERSSTAGEFSNFQNAGRNVYKEVAIMWKNKKSYVD